MKDSASPNPAHPRIDELRRQLTNSPSDAAVYNSIGDIYLTEKCPDQAADAYMHAAAFYTRDGGSLKAIALYKKKGYKHIPNYGQYAEMENSVCFEKNL